MMLFFYTVQELTWCQFFASSLCKSFRDSSIIDSVCHLIILLYHPHFASIVKIVPQNNPIESIYTGTMYCFDKMSKVCIVLFQMMQKFDDVVIFFDPIAKKTWIYPSEVKKITLCQKSNIMSKTVV